MKIDELKKSIEEKYAWPGGYPMYLVMHDGEAVCMDCGKSEWSIIEDSTRTRRNDGWTVAGVDVNYEDVELYCANCNKRIESAYGEEENHESL